MCKICSGYPEYRPPVFPHLPCNGGSHLSLIGFSSAERKRLDRLCLDIETVMNPGAIMNPGMDIPPMKTASLASWIERMRKLLPVMSFLAWAMVIWLVTYCYLKGDVR